MSELKARYRETLNQILALEERKKELARHILQQRVAAERRQPIRDFVMLDLEKHSVLSQTMAASIMARDQEVLDSIIYLYGVASAEELRKKIETHLTLCQRMLEVLNKEIECADSLDFLERRLLTEIDKQIVRQAREYLSMK